MVYFKIQNILSADVWRSETRQLTRQVADRVACWVLSHVLTGSFGFGVRRSTDENWRTIYGSGQLLWVNGQSFWGEILP